MKLSEILSRDSIAADLTATTKPEVIRELSEAISRSRKASAAELYAVLMEREALGSTGIGGGIAIPHGKLNAITDVVVGFGRSRKGVDYDSLDNRPVHIFFVLLTSENAAGGHLKVLAHISKLLKLTAFKQELLSADTAEDIYQVILDQDEEF